MMVNDYCTECIIVREMQGRQRNSILGSGRIKLWRNEREVRG